LTVGIFRLSCIWLKRKKKERIPNKGYLFKNIRFNVTDVFSVYYTQKNAFSVIPNKNRKKMILIPIFS